MIGPGLLPPGSSGVDIIKRMLYGTDDGLSQALSSNSLRISLSEEGKNAGKDIGSLHGAKEASLVIVVMILIVVVLLVLLVLYSGHMVLVV